MIDRKMRRSNSPSRSLTMSRTLSTWWALDKRMMTVYRSLFQGYRANRRIFCVHFPTRCSWAISASDINPIK
jgi:hypothetical protein